MRIEEFLKRHGLARDPFANAEEALGDEVLSELLKQKEFQFGHPQWTKFLGNPVGNQTSIVFGMKGSGKTAMRLALNAAIENNNRQTDDKVLLVNYDEFNDYLAARYTRTQTLRPKRGFWNRLIRRQELPPQQPWTLADHMDALLANTIRLLVQQIASGSINTAVWPHQMKCDVLMIGGMFLPETSVEYLRNLEATRRRMFSPLSRFGARLKKLLLGVPTLGIYTLYERQRYGELAKRLRETVTVINRDIADYRRALSAIPLKHLKNQPIVGSGTPQLTEAARYSLFEKLIKITRAAGYQRIVVVIDKVDEPTAIRGDYDRMAEFIRPLLNNKLLQTSGVHFKMLLPGQLHEMIRKADRDLLNTARLDKANTIHPFTWSGEQLYEMLTERAAVSGIELADTFELQSLFHPSIRRDEIIAALGQTKLPRYAAKLMTRLLARTCQEIITQDIDGQKPLISPKIFYKVCEGLEKEMIEDRQDLRET